MVFNEWMSTESAPLSYEELLVENERLRLKLLELQEREEKLQRLLRRDSTNSSQAPSQDKRSKPKRKRKKSKRKPGGQPGHAGKTREALPSDKVTRQITCELAARCATCGHDGVRERGVRVQQVVDLNEVVELLLSTGRCAGCRKRRTATRPDGYTASVVGSKLLSFVGYSTGILGVSRRRVVRMLDEVFDIQLSLGTVSWREAEIAAALEPPCEEIKDAIGDAEALHLDETGQRKCGGRVTAWVASTLSFTAMFLGRRRDRRTLMSIIRRNGKKPFSGVMITDRYKVYDIDEKRQLCLEHLRRNFLALACENGIIGDVSRRCTSAVRRVLIAWRDHRARCIDTARYTSIVQRCRRRIEAELTRAWTAQGPMLLAELKTLTYAFFLDGHSIWRFVDDKKVEPTNNRGERDIREYVLRRKVSLHTWSDRGDLYLERTLSVAGTCRKQGMSPFAFLQNAVWALRTSTPAPRLLAA